MTARMTKILLSLTLAAFALVVAYDNLIDYGSNFAFVRHVLSMDTTFPGNALLDRAITRPWIWHVGYVLIIVGEAVTGVLLLLGSIVLWRARRSPASAFQAAKRWVVAGCGLGFVVCHGNGIGTLQPARQVKIAAAVRAEGIVLARRGATAFGARQCLAQRLDLGGPLFVSFRHGQPSVQPVCTS